MDRTPLPLAPDNWHKHGFHGAFLWSGVPVLVREFGLYPEAQLPDGTTTRDAPHVRIGIGNSITNGVKRYAGFTVHAVGRYVNGHRRALQVVDASDYSGRNETADAAPWIDKALAYLPQAAELLARIDAIYDEALTRLAALQRHPGPFTTREAYERACADLGAEPVPDERCSTCGAFNFPEYPVETIIARVLEQRRAWHLEDEARKREAERLAGAPRQPPEMQGQLWQECERCGREPCYMPLMLCEDCWPKA